ncbi:hypothetical protein T484DRAFT_1808100 [Baffinella frigidus]|nr:hypothetical protein T484DRAFT_1808100 [Cryptophyta sp. CCMP2293]
MSSGGEAKAIKEYIREHEHQKPCPFIILVRQLPMAVLYDPAALDPTTSAIADRLRKQAKTRAIKLLREVIFDEESGVTAAMLRGREGPLVMQRASPLHSDAGPTANFIVFHAFVNVSRQTPSADAHSAHSGEESGEGAVLRPSGAGNSGHNSARNSGNSAWQFFPVSLTVVAIGDGEIEKSTQPKLMRRITQMMNKEVE